MYRICGWCGEESGGGHGECEDALVSLLTSPAPGPPLPQPVVLPAAQRADAYTRSVVIPAISVAGGLVTGVVTRIGLALEPFVP